MRLHSRSFENRQPIPAEFAAGQPTADGFGFAGNRNPHLAWDDVPANTRSFALVCVDPDVPTVPEMVGRDDVQIPVDQPRADFVHWVIVDLPGSLRELEAGACSDGVVPHGKQKPDGPAGSRQGLNSYTGWFAGNPDMAGDWHGYDGPFPPPNDLRVHRYFFRLFALDVERLDVPERFDATDVFYALHGHVLAETTIYGTYTLNPVAKG